MWDRDFLVSFLNIETKEEFEFREGYTPQFLPRIGEEFTLIDDNANELLEGIVTNIRWIIDKELSASVVISIKPSDVGKDARLY